MACFLNKSDQSTVVRFILRNWSHPSTVVDFFGLIYSDRWTNCGSFVIECIFFALDALSAVLGCSLWVAYVC